MFIIQISTIYIVAALNTITLLQNYFFDIPLEFFCRPIEVLLTAYHLL